MNDVSRLPDDEDIIEDIVGQLMEFPKSRDSLIPVLQMIQHRHSYLSPQAIESVAAGSHAPAVGSPQGPNVGARAGLSPTYHLRPEESQTLRIRVRRKSFSAAGARIAIRAVTATDVVRHDLAADLPRNPGVDLLVDGLAETIRGIRDHFDLTVLLVEHHMSLVMSVSDHIVALNFGKKIADSQFVAFVQKTF